MEWNGRNRDTEGNSSIVLYCSESRRYPFGCTVFSVLYIWFPRRVVCLMPQLATTNCRKVGAADTNLTAWQYGHFIIQYCHCYSNQSGCTECWADIGHPSSHQPGAVQRYTTYNAVTGGWSIRDRIKWDRLRAVVPQLCTGSNPVSAAAWPYAAGSAVPTPMLAAASMRMVSRKRTAAATTGPDIIEARWRHATCNTIRPCTPIHNYAPGNTAVIPSAIVASSSCRGYTGKSDVAYWAPIPHFVPPEKWTAKEVAVILKIFHTIFQPAGRLQPKQTLLKQDFIMFGGKNHGTQRRAVTG